MKLILTPSVENLTLALYNTETNESMLVPSTPDQFNTDADESRPRHRPYGITWNQDTIFVANRKNLLIYDNQLNAIEVRRNILDQNTHSILYKDGVLVCALVRKECLGFYNVFTEEMEMYHPEYGWASDYPDNGLAYEYRLNAVAEKDDVIYFVLYNSKTGYKELHGVNVVTRQPVETKIYTCNATHSHGIMIRRGQFLTLDTGGLLQDINNPKLVIEIPSDDYKARGMAGDDIEWACGYHMWDYTGDGSYINTYNFSRQLTSEEPPKRVRYVDGVGSVNDMRRIDGVDFCHRNPYDFPYTGF